MRCPTCGIECRVKSIETENGMTIRFFCRNKQCPKYAKDDSALEVAQKTIAKAP